MTNRTTPSGTDEGPDTARGHGAPAIDPDLVRRRYGSARPGVSRRAQWLVPLVGALVLVVGAVGISLAMNQEEDVLVEHVGYTVTRPDEVEVRFVVVAEPGTEVVCTLRAVNVDFTEVGVREVHIGPVVERRTAAVEPIVTSERAASGHAESCRPTG